MTTVTWVKLLFSTIGLGIWFYGVQVANRRLQWLGIGVVVVAFLLRFLPKEPNA
jgi:hypothetical protein